jgi:hypothetical protein
MIQSNDLKIRIGETVGYACIACINTGVKVKQVLLKIAEVSSYAMFTGQATSSGLQGLSKTIVADLKGFSTFFPQYKARLELCANGFEAHRKLLYATAFLETTPEYFIKVTNEGGKNKYSLQLPKKADGSIDCVKLFTGIANFFDTGKFLQDCKIYDPPLYTKLATGFGSIKLFNIRGETWSIKDIPFINCWCSQPKDFWIALASMCTIYRCFTDPKDWSEFKDELNLAKLFGGIGKIVLIGFSQILHRKEYFRTFAIINMATQTISLFSSVLKDYRAKQTRFDKKPTVKWNF